VSSKSAIFHEVYVLYRVTGQKRRRKDNISETKPQTTGQY